MNKLEALEVLNNGAFMAHYHRAIKGKNQVEMHVRMEVAREFILATRAYASAQLAEIARLQAEIAALKAAK